MIFKKISNKKKSSSKASRSRHLVNYMLNPMSKGGSEKCTYASARGFISGTTRGWIAELAAVAMQSVRSKDPLGHYCLSWQYDERPSHDQVEQAVDVLMAQFGLKNHQCIYSLHEDTDNIHLHVLVNRVDLSTGRATEINKGFDIEAGHRAIAVIESLQGWKSEKNARYEVKASGSVAIKPLRNEIREAQPRQKRQDIEWRTGEKSAERLAIEVMEKVLFKVGSWEELHSTLANHGMRYEKFGSGAKIFWGDVPLKVSSVNRSATIKVLEGRFGPYEASAIGSPIDMASKSNAEQGDSRQENDLQLQVARAVLRQSKSWAELHARFGKLGFEYVKVGSGAKVCLGERRWMKASDIDRKGTLKLLEKRLGKYVPDTAGIRANTALQKISVDALNRGDTNMRVAKQPLAENFRGQGWEQYTLARNNYRVSRKKKLHDMKVAQAAERMELAEAQWEERRVLLAGDWRGKGVQLNVARSLLARQQATAKLDLRDRQMTAMQSVRANYPNFPSWKSWSQGERAASANGSDMLTSAAGSGNWSVVPVDLRSFVGRVSGRTIQYLHVAFAELPGASPSFTDHGAGIHVHDHKNEASILAALQLASQKYGAFRLVGSEEFVNRCIPFIAKHGFRILNAELQQTIDDARAALRVGSRHAAAGNQSILTGPTSPGSRWVGRSENRQSQPGINNDGGKI
jgi:hypothetical protein